MEAGLSTKNAPSPSIVLPHYIFGAISFLIATVLLLISSSGDFTHYMSPKLLSITHIMVLGWITMIIMGALYQLVPVVMEVRLHSEKIALITFIVFGLGVTFMSIAFWSFTFSRSILLEIGGVLVLIAMILFAFNILKSALKTQRKDIENTFVITSVFWLLITVIAGIIITFNFAFNFIHESHIQLLKMHAHIGVVGWFLLLVIGVASKLMPMFLIVHKLPRTLLIYSFIFTNIGLIMLTTGYYYINHQWFLILSSGLIILGIFFFLRFNLIAFRKRIRKNLDTGMKLSAAAFMMLGISVLFGLFSVITPDLFTDIQNRIDITYGFLILFGFLTSLVLGQTYKTLPFIIWLHRYKSLVGKFTVPLPVELYSDRMANIHYYTYLVGMLFMIIGILSNNVLALKAGASCLLITAILYNYNVFKIIFHKTQNNESK